MASNDPDLGEIVAALARPDAWPDAPASVEVRDTHLSVVLLAGDVVGKLKKRETDALFDYRTADARARNAFDEVALNRRLAPHVYLGVVPVLPGPRLGALGERPADAVDWMVLMRRLPDAGFLDARLSAAEAELRPAALLLADFFARAAPLGVRPAAWRERLADIVRLNHEALRELDEPAVHRVEEGHGAFLARHADLLADRAARVIDGHGDLRPEHVFLGPEPAVIDALEFSPVLRALDPVDEYALLTVECRRLGAAATGAFFQRIYREVTHDDPPRCLWEFHESLRAAVRARLAVGRLREPGADVEKWSDRARGYVRAAAALLEGP